MRLRRPLLEYTRLQLARADRQVERFLTVSDGEREPYVADLADAYARGWSTSPCIFCLSTGRVGTKTLAALLDLSPGVSAFHEPAPRLIKASFDAYMDGGPADGSTTWKDVVLSARDELVFSASSTGRVYAETSNRLTFLGGALRAAFPASKFVHLHRHPYEIIRSGLRRGYYDSHAWDFARIVPRPGEPLADEWPALSRVGKLAWYWSTVNSAILDFLASLPRSQRVELRADELFRGSAEALARLFALVDTDPPGQSSVTEVLGLRMNKEQRPRSFAEEVGPEALEDAWSRVAPVAGRLGYVRRR